MKTQFRIRLFTAAFLLGGTMAVAGMQNDPVEEVPGDNFSLEGALELFKKSASPQEFEQLLNSPDSKVNNLDLNGDGEIDYIRVIEAWKALWSCSRNRLHRRSLSSFSTHPTRRSTTLTSTETVKSITSV